MTIDDEYQVSLSVYGIGARSGPRTRDYFNVGADRIKHISHESDGLHFTLQDPGGLNKGRDHCAVVANSLIDENYIRRHGDKIALLEETAEALAAEVIALTTKLNAVRAILEEEDPAS